MKLCLHPAGRQSAIEFFRLISHAVSMDETPQQTPPAGRKKIRLTKSEVYAMGISTPKKKRLAFGAVGLLVAAILGAALWNFQDLWLPYWLPEKTAEAPASAPETAPAMHAR